MRLGRGRRGGLLAGGVALVGGGQRARARGNGSIEGPARVDRRTKDLIKRLRPGDIAVVDHADIDPVAADGLVESGTAAVVNAAESISGRYPTTGPLRIVEAGIPLLDGAGSDLLERLADGDRLEIDEVGVVRRDGEVLTTASRLGASEIGSRMDAARDAIGGELERFAKNTLDYIREEARLTFAPLDLPPLRTLFEGRHALVVVRGHDYREDLRALRPYIREYRPVLIGVDGGADALLELGMRPDVILGDFDSLSDRAWACGAELLHHVHPDGRDPGRDQLESMGLPYQRFVVEGTSEDAAMLLAYEARSKLIVAVGTHAGMVEFLDKGRQGMSSTFLTRMRLGPSLVDAKGVSQLYAGRVRGRDILLLMAAAFTVMIVVAIISEPTRVFFDAFWLTLRDLWLSMTGAF